MITLPTNHPYFFTCPSCGCKLISVSTGNRAKPHCPKCDYSADDAFVVKDRVTSEAMNVIADNTELAENFAETLTPPTIEIVGFPGGGGKAYHHAAYKAASYAVSHHPLRV